MAVFTYRIFLVWEMTTMHATFETIVHQSPPPTVLTTSMLDQGNNHPFGFAIDFHTGQPQLGPQNYTFDIKVFMSTLSGDIIR
jgi:hypothetical protein